MNEDPAPKKELNVVGQQLRFSRTPQVDPEGQAAVREFAVQSPAGYQQGNMGAGGLQNQLGAIPSILQYGSTAGEMANARRGACAACKHFDVRAWRKYISDATNPGSTPEMRQTIATFKARIAMAGYGYEKPDGSVDIDGTLAAHGICRVLSDWVEGAVGKDPVFWPVVPWREATCPPDCRAGTHEPLKVVTPEKPLGFYVPIGLDEKKIGAKRYDEVLNAARGFKK